MLNSLAWDIWFSLINNNHLMFRLSYFCYKNAIYPGFPHCLLGTVHSGWLEMLPFGLEVLKIPAQKNIALNFYIVNIFFSQQFLLQICWKYTFFSEVGYFFLIYFSGMMIQKKLCHVSTSFTCRKHKLR